LYISELNQSPLASPVQDRRNMPSGLFADHQMQQQIASLKQQQDLQQQLLLQQFQAQQQQLAQEHEKQMQEHIKVNMVGQSHCNFSFIHELLKSSLQGDN